jgi:hypothetical protein
VVNDRRAAAPVVRHEEFHISTDTTCCIGGVMAAHANVAPVTNASAERCLKVPELAC